jgi:hypothetical protein
VVRASIGRRWTCPIARRTLRVAKRSFTTFVAWTWPPARTGSSRNLSARAAQRIADLAGGSLATPRMVDAIWAAADLRVEPIRFRPDEFMRSVEYIERHNDLVRAQLMVYNESPGVFLAGHKLDVVITASLSEHPGEIAIYGWHRSNGTPVQSLYVGATDSLVAFSHGVRLVHRAVLVDGVPRDLHDVLGDTALASILSAGGVIARARYPEPSGAQ